MPRTPLRLRASCARLPPPVLVPVGLVLARPQHGPHDVLVAGAPADLPGERLTDLLRCRVRVVIKQPPRGHHHAGGAEPALQPVTLAEPLLDRVELSARGQV